MHGSSFVRLLAVFVLASGSAFLNGQTEAKSGLEFKPDFVLRMPVPVQPPGTGIHPPRRPINPRGVFGFPRFVRAAGMIFSGTVSQIERHPANVGQSVETIAVTFHVESGIRGAMPGGNLTIVQWVGLWSAGQRYRVGERVLLFLYPNSKLGLTSCVGGQLGRLAVDPTGHVLLTAQHLSAFREDPVLGGKSRPRLSDFALAVRRASEEE